VTEAETLSEVPTAVPSMRAHLARASTPCTFTTRAEPPAIISTARPVRPFLGAERSLFVGHHGNVVWGVLFKDPSLPGGLLALAATLALIATAKADEAECTRFFGPAYRDYMQRTRMFVPFLF